MGTEDLAERLSAIAEELGELAYDALREASAGVGDGSGAPDQALLEHERRLTRARRAVEKAASLLRGAASSREEDR